MEIVVDREKLIGIIKKQRSIIRGDSLTSLYTSDDGMLYAGAYSAKMSKIIAKERIDAEIRSGGSVTVDDNLIMGALEQMESDKVLLMKGDESLLIRGNFTVEIGKRFLRRDGIDPKAELTEIGRAILPTKALAEVYSNSIKIWKDIEMYYTMYLCTKNRMLYAVTMGRDSIGAVSYAPIDSDKEIEILLDLSTISSSIIEEITNLCDSLEVVVYMENSQNKKYVIDFSNGNFTLTYIYIYETIKQFPNFLPDFLLGKNKRVHRAIVEQSDLMYAINYLRPRHKTNFTIDRDELVLEIDFLYPTKIRIGADISDKSDRSMFVLNTYDIKKVLGILFEQKEVIIDLVGGVEKVVDNIVKLSNCFVVLQACRAGVDAFIFPNITVYQWKNVYK